MLGPKRIQKTVKTKFKQYEEDTKTSKEKKKHHDKTMYRLQKQQEKEDYAY